MEVKALVASQSRELRDQVSDILCGASHQVAATDRSGELLNRVLNEAFDLLVIDVDLCGMDGVESLSVLRRIRPKIPVVMVSGDVSTQVSQQIAREGVFYHFNKPIYEQDFLEVVDAVAKRELHEEAGG